jgi:hypothetical protein
MTSGVNKLIAITADDMRVSQCLYLVTVALLVLVSLSALLVTGHPFRPVWRLRRAQAATSAASSPRLFTSDDSGGGGGGSSSDDDDGPDSDYLSANTDGNGYRSEFVMGKDKELFHASIDLGWLYNTIVNKQNWLAICSKTWQSLCRFNPNYNQKCLYRESALTIASKLTALNPDCHLR